MHYNSFSRFFVFHFVSKTYLIIATKISENDDHERRRKALHGAASAHSFSKVRISVRRLLDS